MEVKIGVTNAVRELSLESRQSADDIRQAMAAALSGDGQVFSLSDERGRTVLVPAQKLAYVEISDESGRRVGFGTG
ncbi:MAG TPA: DUF3107 domain-containing protein [Nocardioidaceae bacterium]|nr:DUF3107 domain-containing protein [Nocardioidaceae bacterium]